MRLFEGTPFDRPPRCPRCDELEEECRCPPEPQSPPKQTVPPHKQTARLSIEKRKRGKRVTRVVGLSADETDLEHLLKQLKDRCGSGGRIDDGVLEIQGDQRDVIQRLLVEIGYRIQK